MTRPYGPQWQDSFGPEPVRLNAISIINKNDGELTHAQTKQVFRGANIRYWPADTIDENYDTDYNGLDDISPDLTLHTSQRKLFAPAVRDYMKDNPAHRSPLEGLDEEGDFLDNREDYPYVITSPSGSSNWIIEGHHRLVASRLMRHPFTFINSLEYYKHRLGNK